MIHSHCLVLLHEICKLQKRVDAELGAGRGRLGGYAGGLDASMEACPSVAFLCSSLAVNRQRSGLELDSRTVNHKCDKKEIHYL